MADDDMTISIVRREPMAPSATELRDRLIDALELRLCQHGRSATFASMIRDVLDVLDHGDEQHGVPPISLVANPAPEHTRSCRQMGIPCPSPARIEEGTVLLDITAAWERRVRRLVKPCAPLSDGRKRVIEAKFNETHSTTARLSTSGFWSLLLECGHVVKRRAEPSTRTRVPKWAPCPKCAERQES